MPQAQTMEIIIFAAIGLRVIAVIERPLRGWRLGLVLAMVGVYVFGFWWSVTAELLRRRVAHELGGDRRDRGLVRLRLVLGGTGQDRSATACRSGGKKRTLWRSSCRAAGEQTIEVSSLREPRRG